MVNIVDNGGIGELEKAPTDEMNADSQDKAVPEEVVSVLLSPRSDFRAAKFAEEEANKAKLAAEMEVRTSRILFSS
jgi:hypothetical protein